MDNSRYSGKEHDEYRTRGQECDRPAFYRGMKLWNSLKPSKNILFLQGCFSGCVDVSVKIYFKSDAVGVMGQLRSMGPVCGPDWTLGARISPVLWDLGTMPQDVGSEPPSWVPVASSRAPHHL